MKIIIFTIFFTMLDIVIPRHISLSPHFCLGSTAAASGTNFEVLPATHQDRGFDFEKWVSLAFTPCSWNRPIDRPS